MMHLFRLVMIATVAAGLAACENAAEKPTAAATTPPPTTAQVVAPPEPLADCPVTMPVVAPDPPVPEGALFGWGYSHGNADLWVGGLGTGGVLGLETQADGYLGNKFGWYRIARGQLTITGKRIDGAAPPIRTHVPEGYGDSGFQSSGIDFSSPGCWEVTGTVGTAKLTFVTYVVNV